MDSKGLEGLELALPEPTDAIVDIVAVHGLNSGSLQAWTHVDGNKRTTWVNNVDFLGDLAAKARIMTFGYNANAFGDIIQATIVDHAIVLLEQLIYQRRKKTKHRPIIFVAHSLGGLVVKQALLQAMFDPNRYSTIRDSAEAIIFMGTPHHGADFTSILQFLEHLHALVTWKKAASTAMAKELEIFSRPIVEINRNFKADGMEILSIYETKETRIPHYKMSALIVKQGSAIMSGGRSLSMSCTHEELCKFPSPQDSRFKSFIQQLRMIVDQVEEKQESLKAESLKRRRDSPVLRPEARKGVSDFSIELPD